MRIKSETGGTVLVWPMLMQGAQPWPWTVRAGDGRNPKASRTMIARRSGRRIYRIA